MISIILEVFVRFIDIPNYLTVFRLLLVPCFLVVVLLQQSNSFWPALIFALASATDWLDGFIAKQFNATTRFGAFLDPIADKILVISALLVLLFLQHTLLLFFCSIIIISREIVVTALREWMAIIGERTKVNVQFVGRLKAAFQMIGITICLLQPQNYFFGTLGNILLVFSVILTLASMYFYLVASRKHLTFN